MDEFDKLFAPTDRLDGMIFDRAYEMAGHYEDESGNLTPGTLDVVSMVTPSGNRCAWADGNGYGGIGQGGALDMERVGTPRDFRTVVTAERGSYRFWPDRGELRRIGMGSVLVDPM